MNVGGIKANTGQRQMCREVACEEILIIVNLIIAKSVHKLPLKASKQIAFANLQNRSSNSLISVSEPESQ